MESHAAIALPARIKLKNFQDYVVYKIYYNMLRAENN